MSDRLKHRAILPIIAFAIIIIGAIIVICTRFQIKTVTFSGNSYYTDDEIYNTLFTNQLEKNTLYCLLNNKLGKEKTIPFVERYQIDMVSPSEIEIIIYEKNIIGYIDYMGSNMYFDRDGIVVESSQREIDRIPQITGINFNKIVLYQKLETENAGIFSEILILTQLLQKFDMNVDNVYFDKNSQASMQVGNILVELGSAELLDGKIAELNDILPNLDGKKGTLYLDNYKEGALQSTYVFKNEK